MFHNRHFSITEAQDLLPEIKVKLLKITNLKKELSEKSIDVYRHHYFGGIGPNGTGKYPKELEELIKMIHEFSVDGILIKSIDDGLIDFPHIRYNGEEVYLCFLLGEDSINYWHTIDSGFSGRRNIGEL